MTALYIGQCNIGSTSRCRFDVLRKITKDNIDLIDISDDIEASSRIFRSIGWRYYIGPLIWRINLKVKKKAIKRNGKYDFIWIDKGVFIKKRTLQYLKLKATTIIHYTPDTAFFSNDSFHFRKSLYLYNYLITTKSFEIDTYSKYVSKNRIFFLTQGINTTVHFPQFDFKEKELAIVFVGLYENSRAEVILKLINAGFKVYIAGIGWSKFLNLYRCDNLNFIGSNLNDFEYSKALSKCIFALGLLQKKFPELHTTRTFEIPACGTCLITERNHEIDSFFNDDECIKYTNIEELIMNLDKYSNNVGNIKKIIDNGRKRVQFDKRDYDSQLTEFFRENLTEFI
jgi:spore maturation protein CgeB